MVGREKTGITQGILNSNLSGDPVNVSKNE